MFVGSKIHFLFCCVCVFKRNDMDIDSFTLSWFFGVRAADAGGNKFDQYGDKEARGGGHFFVVP